MTTLGNFIEAIRAAAPGAAWTFSLRLILQWALLALALHLLWEIGHLPFYALWGEVDAWRIVLYVAHCTLGDVMIATLAHLAVALVWRRADWPRLRPWSGGTLLLALGLGYTAFSEWYNVYRIGSWGYSETMPLIYGIGLTPLLQWLIVPGVMLVAVRQMWNKLPVNC